MVAYDVEWRNKTIDRTIEQIYFEELRFEKIYIWTLRIALWLTFIAYKMHRNLYNSKYGVMGPINCDHNAPTTFIHNSEAGHGQSMFHVKLMTSDGY